MGIVKTHPDELLVVGLLYSDSASEKRARAMLENHYGPIAELTGEEVFLWTDYYCPEMGQRIFRRYLAFERLFNPSLLASIKLKTNEIEGMLACEGRRLVNLDPGMLGPGRFCLATTKDRAHRIPLGGGILAELTLLYERGCFHPLPWTYPDWASEPVREMLACWRKRLFKTSAG